MKKTFLLVMLAFWMNATQSLFAQINNVSVDYDSPCEGTCVFLTVDTSGYTNPPGSYVVCTKAGGLPASWLLDPNGFFVQSCGFMPSDNGSYTVTLYNSNGVFIDDTTVTIFVNPTPNAGYQLVEKCNSITLIPFGADGYATYDPVRGEFIIPFDSLYLTGTGLLFVGGGFRAFTTNGCYTDVTINQIWANPLVITATPSKWKIAPGESSTITASANYPLNLSKTKWFKDGVQFTQNTLSVTVSDTGLYKVQMRATASSGNCVKSKQIRIKAKPVPSASGSESEKFEGVQSTLDLQLGPNPASDQIQIAGYDQLIVIVDINGQPIRKYEIDTFYGNENPFVIDVSAFPNGIYLVRSGEQTSKLIVSH